MKIFLLGSYDLSLTNFRGPLIAEMVRRGHDVIAAAPSEHADIPDKLAELGAVFEAVPFDRVGKNPLSDVALYNRLRSVLRRHRPDVLLAYTAKPVIYGSLAARREGVLKIASMITGAGFALPGRGIANRAIGWVVRRLYRSALAVNDVVFFQNPDDLDIFVEQGLVSRVKTVRINGSGIDLDEFSQRPLPSGNTFVLISRMIRDKGIAEFAAAARIVKARYPTAEFHLVGPLDPHPRALRRNEIASWEEEGVLTYHGYQPDVRPFLERCSAFVLPSYYREGVPRTLLEAMAVGRPIITTDSAGCRETIQIMGDNQRAASCVTVSGIVQGENGFLIPPQDPEAISEAIFRLMGNRRLMQSMADASRRLARERFDVHDVNRDVLSALGL